MVGGGMREKGECWGDVVAGRFFGIRKTERTNHRVCAMREEAKADIIDYIKLFYSSGRLCSYLGYVIRYKYVKLVRAA